MKWCSLWLETVGDEQNRVARERILSRAAIILGAKSHLTYPWHELSRANVEHLKRTFIDMGMAQSTVRYQLVTIRSLCTLIYEEGGMEEARLRSLRRCDLPPKSGNGHVGRQLSTYECAEILLLSPDTASVRMKQAEFALLITTGLRASELCSVTTTSVTDDGIVTVYGKGGKRRLVALVPSIREILGRHREDCDKELPWLVQNVLHDNKCQLDRRRLLLDMKTLAAAAGLETFSAHDCRRTAASALMDEGVDVFTVADLLGHASVDTTRMYDKRPYSKKLLAMKTLGEYVQGKGTEEHVDG